jgi:hypothetical protein
MNTSMTSSRRAKELEAIERTAKAAKVTGTGREARGKVYREGASSQVVDATIGSCQRRRWNLHDRANERIR